jgi:hypothetical protein
MVEKTLKVCDYCENPTMADYKCDMCGKDICHIHAKSIYIDFYNPMNRTSEYNFKPNTLKLQIFFTRGIHIKDKGKIICKDCVERFCNMLEILSKADKCHIVDEIMEKIESIAKIEAI